MFNMSQVYRQKHDTHEFMSLTIFATPWVETRFRAEGTSTSFLSSELQALNQQPSKFFSVIRNKINPFFVAHRI